MKKTVVCFGDSNTHGYNPETGGRYDDTQRYPMLLAELSGTDYLIREEGLSGRTTVFDDPLCEGLSGLSAIYPCLMTHEPVSLLTIMLGTNDTKERFGANPENIAKGMERLVSKARSTAGAWEHGQPNILIIAPPPIADGYENRIFGQEMGRGCSEKSRRLAEYYRLTATRQHCHFLDAAQIPGIAMHPEDLMHLDRQSHKLLAEALAELIPSLIAMNSAN